MRPTVSRPNHLALPDRALRFGPDHGPSQQPRTLWIRFRHVLDGEKRLRFTGFLFTGGMK